ncbi:MAG TPA: hypothetical protein VF532_14325 [Candidatus Angelobacter sp.]
MSVNKDLPHVLVLPEDDANRQIAAGFHLEINWDRQRQMQVLPEAGGWTHVIDSFLADHVVAMNRYPARLMVLLIDCDGDGQRLGRAKARVPGQLTERVFVLGALTEPEALKANLGHYEVIGKSMARDCREGTEVVWGHDLLRTMQRNLTAYGRRYARSCFL